MSRYKEYAVKLIAIAIAEGIFFFLMPLLARELGSHPYELLSVAVSGIVVAYAVIKFFESLSDSKFKIKTEQDIKRLQEKLEKQGSSIHAIKLDDEIKKEVEEVRRKP